MKMENEIQATQSGVIQDILVAEGQNVEQGTVLLEIKPAPVTGH
jgi:biotin carboxyl carrier protein